VLACVPHGVDSSTEPTLGFSADSLIVSLDDVRLFADNDSLTSRPESDVHQPTRRQAGPDVPSACKAVFGGEETFAGGWRQFRSVQYSGSTRPTVSGGGNLYSAVSQAVGIYPDEEAARAAFDHVASTLTACSALHDKYYDFSVKNEDSTTVVLDYSNQYLHDIMSNMIRVKSCVLAYVEVGGFPQSERIAQTVLQTITDRVA
jgi:hypothetical protein